MKLLSLDLEYNNKKEILSSGIVYSNFFNIEKIEEKFFKNNVDKFTYHIHGLNQTFLNENSKDKIYDISHLIKNTNYIVGFDLQHDFKVLELNKNKLYASNKIIDLKYILDIFDFKISLSNLFEKTELMKKYKNLLPIHTSVMDSFLSFVFLEYLCNFIKKETNFSIENILKDLALLSNYKYFSQYWLYEPLSEQYYFLKTLLNEIENKEINNSIEEVKPKVLFLNDNVEIYDNNFYIIGKYKKSDFYLKKFEQINIKTKKDISIGYRDLLIK